MHRNIYKVHSTIRWNSLKNGSIKERKQFYIIYSVDLVSKIPPQVYGKESAFSVVSFTHTSCFWMKTKEGEASKFSKSPAIYALELYKVAFKFKRASAMTKSLKKVGLALLSFLYRFKLLMSCHELFRFQVFFREKTQKYPRVKILFTSIAVAIIIFYDCLDYFGSTRKLIHELN